MKRTLELLKSLAESKDFANEFWDLHPMDMENVETILHFSKIIQDLQSEIKTVHEIVPIEY